MSQIEMDDIDSSASCVTIKDSYLIDDRIAHESEKTLRTDQGKSIKINLRPHKTTKIQTKNKENIIKYATNSLKSKNMVPTTMKKPRTS